MFKYIQRTAAILFALFGAWPVFAQSEEPAQQKKAWEIGVGGSIIQHSRFNSGRIDRNDGGYSTQFNIHQVLSGGNLYVARELKPWLYLDMQGTVGADRVKTAGMKARYDNFYLMGPGLQFRFGTLLKSNYFEPYARVGINYLHKSFVASYSGKLQDENGNDFPFEISDQFNKNREDKKNFYPFSLGVGLNSWLNDCFGVGLQADYVAAFYNKTPHYPMVTLRAMFRFGGKSKKMKIVPQTTPVEVERVVERLVEKPVEVVKVVEKPVVEYLFAQLQSVNFEFDKAVIRPESAQTLDDVARVLKSDTVKDKHFLITGFADARGSVEYNLDLSERRASALVEALELRGVPKGMLKSRGVGKAVAAVPGSEPDVIREGDRKVTIEIITNEKYWDFLP